MQTEKKKRGRPVSKKGTELRVALAHVTLTVEEKWEMQDIAEKKGMSVSDFIRFLFVKYKENSL